MVKWKSQMDQWYESKDAQKKQNIGKILNELGVVTGKETQKIDWGIVCAKLFPHGEADIKSFVNAVKKTDNFQEILPIAREMAGIFGKEVAEELFRPKTDKSVENKSNLINKKEQWNQHIEGRKRVIEKAFKAGRIDKEEKEKFVKYLEEEKGNNERVLNFNGVTFEGFAKQDQDYIKSAMKMLPQELIYHIKKVKIASQEEVKGAMCYWPNKRHGEGVVGITPETFGYDKSVFTRKVLHEIGGHGLRDMVNALNPDLHRQLVSLWSQTANQRQGLLGKDIYARDIISGKIYKDHLRYGNAIYASVDEFWSDRMAEYFYAKAGKSQGSGERVYSNRDITNPFTPAEEEAVQKVCEATYQIWLKTLNKK